MENLNNKTKQWIREEQRDLDNLIEEIDVALNAATEEEAQARTNKRNYRGHDSADTYLSWQVEKNNQKYAQDKAKELRESKEELYHVSARLSVTDSDGIQRMEDYKIAKKAVAIHGNVLVYSWKAPVGQRLFNKKISSEFKIKDPESREITYYEVKCRRDVKMSYNTVVSVSQTHPTEEGPSSQDRFSNELVRRRQDTEFEDIIFSMQEEQMKIVQEPLETNILVQGCAGSGKSLIQFHRLSLLLYDREKINSSNIYIITPSYSYILMVQNMLKELEIPDIPMGTLTQYYEHILKKYGRRLDEFGIRSSAAKVKPDLERYIYSRQCKDDIHTMLDQECAKQEVNYRREFSFFSSAQNMIHMGSIQNDRMPRERFDDQINICQKIIDINQKNMRIFFKSLCDAINASNRLLRAVDDEIKNVKNLSKNISNAERYVAGVKVDLQNPRKRYSPSQINNLQKEIINKQDFLIRSLKEKNKIEGYEETYINKFLVVSNELKQMRQIYANLDQSYEKHNWKELYFWFAYAPTFIKQYGRISQEIRDIGAQFSTDASISAVPSAIIELVRHTDEVVGKLQSSDIKILPRESMQRLVTANRDLQTKKDHLAAEVYQEILARAGIEEKGWIYSFSPYLVIQILYQYQGAPNKDPESFISIDEAQCLAPEEIFLIQAVNHNKVVLNLYGDINQHFEDEKGIQNWDEITSKNTYKNYELKENDRNARQITEYCNRRFNLSMIARSPEGKEVKILQTRGELEEELLRILSMPVPEGNCAVIVGSQRESQYIDAKYKNYKDQFIDLTGKENFAVQQRKWNVLSVEQSRGLEFRKAFVFINNMSPNRKYVACTRALEELIVFDDLAAVRKFFEEKGLTVVDQKDHSSMKYLWVMGNKGYIEQYVKEAEKKFSISGTYFVQAEFLDGQPGWRTSLLDVR